MTEITSLMMDDHAWLRREFARLDDARTLPEQGQVWRAISSRLEIHARAEELIFYPALLKKGGDAAEHETKDAVRDHNKIRAAITAAEAEEVGSAGWWKAVGHARAENSEHMTEEEDEGFPDFRKHADDATREALGRAWEKLRVENPSPAGLEREPVDAREFVKQNR